MKYLDFKIRIWSETAETPEPPGEGARPASYRVRVESPEGTAESTLELPFAIDDLAGAVFGVTETVRHFRPDPGTPVAAGPSSRDFGVELFEALFSGEVRSKLDMTIAAAKAKPDTGTRIRLVMSPQDRRMAAVARLPWELMRGPEQPQPLALSMRTLLVRSLDASVSTDPQPFRAPLRILAVVSNPRGTATLNLEKERQRVTRNWALLRGVQVDFVDPLRAKLLAKLAEVDYHVIHYMGHGDFSNDAGGSLLLTNEDGSPDRITGAELGVFLADRSPSLRLVFLNACKTGTTSGGSGVEPFRGVATSLVEAGVTAVVAMQFPVSDEAAIRFADTFYERIARGYPVDAAVAEARKCLYSSTGPSEWATPVVFLRSTDGVLFGAPAHAETGDGHLVGALVKDLAGQTPPRMLSSPDADDVESASGGIRLLLRLVRRDQAVASAVGRSREIVENTYRQIGRLELFKSLHDALHTIEWDCLRPLQEAGSRSPGTLIARTFGSEARQIRASLLADEIAPSMRDELNDALDEITAAFQAAKAAPDPSATANVVSQLNALISGPPPRLDAAIADSARELNLDRLVEVMDRVRATLGSGADDSSLTKFVEGIDALHRLRDELAQRTEEHGRLQSLDSKLRAVCLGGTRADAVPVEWTRIRKLRGRLALPGSAELQADIEWLEEVERSVDVALTSGDAALAMNHLREYFRLVGQVFRNVDKGLKAFSLRLTGVSQPIKSILDVLDVS